MRQISYAYIETTSYCNLHCAFCNRDEVVQKPTHMSVENYKIVLKKLAKHPIREIKLMGMGEPFMHPKFHEICRLTRETFPEAFIISSTNCQFEFNGNFQKSLQHVDLMYLSIDGYGSNYERYRKPAKWVKLVKFLSACKLQEPRRAKLAINYTVNPDNIGDIGRIQELVAKYKLDEMRLNIVQNWNEGETDEELCHFSDEQLAFLRETFGHMIKGKADWNFSDCFWVKNGLYMTADGDVKVCCMNTSTKPFGNLIRDLSVEQAFSNKRYIEIKNGCETNCPTEHCVTCSYKELTTILSKLK